MNDIYQDSDGYWSYHCKIRNRRIYANKDGYKFGTNEQAVYDKAEYKKAWLRVHPDHNRPFNLGTDRLASPMDKHNWIIQVDNHKGRIWQCPKEELAEENELITQVIDILVGHFLPTDGKITIVESKS